MPMRLVENKPVTFQNKPVTLQNKPVTFQNKPVTLHNKPVTLQNKPVTLQTCEVIFNCQTQCYMKCSRAYIVYIRCCLWHLQERCAIWSRAYCALSIYVVVCDICKNAMLRNCWYVWNNKRICARIVVQRLLNALTMTLQTCYWIVQWKLFKAVMFDLYNKLPDTTRT